MRLHHIITEWAQAALPRELRELYRGYWQLRTRALQIAPALDPYICNIITPQIFKYLKNLGVPVQIHSGYMPAAPIHMWAKIKLPAGIYIVDGSYYQAHYDKPTTNIIPGPLGKRLVRAGITNLRLLLGVVDSKLLGEQQACLDDGSVDVGDYDTYACELDKIAATLTDRELKTIQGRLLPILLYIIPDAGQAGEHKGKLYDPEADSDIHPEWEPHTGHVLGNDEYYNSIHRPVDQDEF